MATKTKARARPAPTPAEVRDAVRACLAHYFPHFENASVAFVPGPGMPPLELVVSGDVFGAAGLTDRWFDKAGEARWDPDAD